MTNSFLTAGASSLRSLLWAVRLGDHLVLVGQGWKEKRYRRQLHKCREGY